jgi:uncharacterized membrane protein
MEITHLLLGPQLIGVIMLICGFMLKQYPPKDINGLYGYRTPSSMQNQQTWDLANSYSARLMIKAGLIAIVTGIILIFLIDMQHEYYMAIAMIVSLIVIVVVVLRSTEKKLKQTFDKDGNALL